MAGRLVPRQRRTILGVVVLAAALAPLLTGPAGAVTVCNNNPVTFTPPPQPTPAVLPWAPYPSVINISGQTGTVSDVNVTFNDFTYQFPEDVDVLLVAPDGTTSLVVMSDIGGNNDGLAEPVIDVDLTFDDEAATTPAADSQLSSGVYRPLDDDNDPGDFVFGNVDQFPAPAPAPGAGTALSVFDGLAPNGNWSLYVVDDEPGPNIPGDFGGGWCLDITTSTGVTDPTTSTSTSTSTTLLPPTSTTTSTSTTLLPPTSTTTSTSTTLLPTSTTTSTSTTLVVPPTSTTTSTSTTLVPPTSTSSSLPASTTTSTTTAPGTCDGRTPTIVGTAGDDQIFGTAGPDVIVGGGGNDSIQGLGGDDVICGGAGNDSILGGEGNDRVFGEAGSDQVYGGNGNDFVSGGAGGDRVWGEAGNDTLDGGADPDQCVGGTGNDTAAACESAVEVP